MTLLFRLTVLTPVIAPREKEAVRRPTTKKCGGSRFKIAHSGVLTLRSDCRRTFLFPVFQKVIQRHVQGSFHALGHDAQNLFFQDGLLLLLIFLLFLLLTVGGVAYSHLILTSLLILTSGISIASASAFLTS